MAVAAAMAGVAGVAGAQNVADNVNTGATTALDTATNYSSNQLPGSTNDMAFTSSSYGTTSFTLNSTALTPGTLDDLDATQTFTITGSQSITLEGGSNSVAPSTADLFYVASGGKLSTNTPIVLTTAAASGNFDLVGAGTLSGAISGSGFGFTKTGAGTLTLSSAASTFSGGVTLNGGVLNIAAGSTGAAGSVTQGPLGTGALTLNGGTLSTVGGNGTLNNAIVANSGTTVVGSVSGPAISTSVVRLQARVPSQTTPQVPPPASITKAT